MAWSETTSMTDSTPSGRMADLIAHENLEMALRLYDHPLSPYGQKVKIALIEKGVEFEGMLPNAIGSGQVDGEFAAANPRGEVPALLDGDAAIFDSTVILEYIEDKWPKPRAAAGRPGRSRARTHARRRDGHALRSDHLGAVGDSQFRQSRRRRGDPARSGRRGRDRSLAQMARAATRRSALVQRRRRSVGATCAWFRS